MSTPSRTNGSSLTHRWAWLLACATFPLIWWGGLVTTTGAGMAFRDWLTSDGYFMPFYPWLSSTGDKFIEHGHRLLGMFVGLLSIGLVAITWVTSESSVVRKMSLAVLAGVLLQGLLGGMRVVFDERTLALIHGCTGPLFFALCAATVVVSSPSWQAAPSRSPTAHDKKFFRLALLTALLAYGQLVAGAVLRHSPHLLGPNAAVVFHAAVYFHLLLALAIAVHAMLLVIRVRHSASAGGMSIVLLALVGVQLLLGASTWIVKYGLPRWAVNLFGELSRANTADDMFQALIVTTHVAVGSLILVTALAITLRSGRGLRLSLPLVTAGLASNMEAIP
jgi:cytochrome c oxidase assembly protein subunit 15